MFSSNRYFLTCIQVSQGAGQVVWYSQLFQNFPQFIVIHTIMLYISQPIYYSIQNFYFLYKQNLVFSSKMMTYYFLLHSLKPPNLSGKILMCTSM